MGIKDRIRNFIIRRIECYIETIELRKKSTENLSIISSVRTMGNNSFFCGDYHFISGGENCKIGENVHIDNNCFIRAEGGLEIGDNTHISRNLVLYTINHDFEGNALPYDNAMKTNKVTIGKNVWIGMNVCIAPGSVIGDGAIVGMGTTVSGTVPERAIIGSQKWRVIGERDEMHYNDLETKRKYGGINGEVYFADPDHRELSETNRKTNTKRGAIEVIEENATKKVIKKFDLSAQSQQSFENEKMAVEIFNNYKWFPKTVVRYDSLEIEYFDHKDRLDKRLPTMSEIEKEDVKAQIIFILLDLYKNGYSHRDLHQKNIFFSNGVVKVIDFETISKIPSNIGFFDSYDITGRNGESPFQTSNMCILNDSHFSLNKLFQVNDISDFKKYFTKAIESELTAISKTFFTRKSNKDGRHTLRRELIYNTFDLKHLKVTTEQGQRNISKRFVQFGIDENLIKNKRILDLGSNIGGVLCELSKFDFKEAVGIEYDTEKVEISKSIAAFNDIYNISFHQSDLETDEFLTIAEGKFDIVFSLAVIEHLKNKVVFLKRLYEKTGEILFIEGNANTDIDELKRYLFGAGFREVNYLGLSDDEQSSQNNNRPLFRAIK